MNKDLYIQAEELLSEKIVEKLEYILKDSLSINFNDEVEVTEMIASIKEVLNILENYDSNVDEYAHDMMAALADRAETMEDML